MDLLKEYSVKVYSDGSIVVKEVMPSTNFKDILSDCSARVQQILLVILQMKVLKENIIKNNEQTEEFEDIDYDKLYPDAINEVAKKLDVSNSTIHDKLERQSNLNAKEMKELIKNFLENINDDLIKSLLDSVKNTKKEKEDRFAIKELYRRLPM